MKPGLRRLCAVVGVILAAATAAGCSEIKYEAGRRPNVQLLETTLKVGQSTPEEVRSALGEPVGKGKTLLPILDSRSRDTWSYYYEEGEVKAVEGGGVQGDDRRIFLFVYFDKGRYDGYLWFSSLPDTQTP